MACPQICRRYAVLTVSITVPDRACITRDTHETVALVRGIHCVRLRADRALDVSQSALVPVLSGAGANRARSRRIYGSPRADPNDGWRTAHRLAPAPRRRPAGRSLFSR